jgi:DNA-binding NarL/FixJ family response regulator
MHEGNSTIACRTVLIADPQPIFRLGLAALLASAHPDWDVIEASTIEETRLQCQDQAVDTLIVGARLLGVEIGSHSPPQLPTQLAKHIIAVTEAGDPLAALGCLAAGAQATIARSDPASQTLETIETTMNRVSHPGTLVSAARVAEAPDPLNLTSRQLDVLRLLAKGQTNKVIARDLGLSVSTVKVHLNTVFRALGATNRVEAVVRARPLQARISNQNP